MKDIKKKDYFYKYNELFEKTNDFDIKEYN